MSELSLVKKGDSAQMVLSRGSTTNNQSEECARSNLNFENAGIWGAGSQYQYFYNTNIGNSLDGKNVAAAVIINANTWTGAVIYIPELDKDVEFSFGDGSSSVAGKARVEKYVDGSYTRLRLFITITSAVNGIYNIKIATQAIIYS